MALDKTQNGGHVAVVTERPTGSLKDRLFVFFSKQRRGDGHHSGNEGGRVRADRAHVQPRPAGLPRDGGEREGERENRASLRIVSSL